MFDPFQYLPGETLDASHSALRQRPDLAARVGCIIGMWAMVELRLSELLSAVLHADARVGGTLFSVIKAEGGRLAMTKAIAEERLVPDDLIEFEALRKRMKVSGG